MSVSTDNQPASGPQLAHTRINHVSNKSRPMSIPMKVIPDTAVDESWTTSEERMKELFSHAWDAVKRLTVQRPFPFTPVLNPISWDTFTPISTPASFLYSFKN
ncbi:hypothetical protein CRENBAI_010830 [Crenichthys baileyi]|uniref:Uncharacterized protein n=1 Tax=Crenichthys baileyi TaxID=28760 RepID=A0AAV9SKX1_9TELE